MLGASGTRVNCESERDLSPRDDESSKKKSLPACSDTRAATLAQTSFRYCPTPDTFDSAFAGPSLFGTFNVKYRLPLTVGEKTMLTAQLLPPAMT